MRILIVEDEDHIRNVLKLNLEIDGYEVIPSENGKKALQLSKEQHFDLIVLDIMLPDISGIEVCQQIRLENLKVPIIMVSAKDTSSDRILGLKTGADDYLTKPFDFQELKLRIEKLIQRSSTGSRESPAYYEFGANKINLITYEAESAHKRIRLTKREAKLLKLLIEHNHEVVSRKQILQAVWGYDVFPSTRTIDNYILSFRKYFEENPKEPQYFHSVRGVGYKFTNNL